MRNKLLIILGLALIMIYYWAMFVYIRPEREIPFQLNILRFLALCCTVTLYGVVLYKALKSSKNTVKLELPSVLLQLINIIKESFKIVDDNLKYPMLSYYEKFICYIADKINVEKTTRWAKILFIVNLIPRLILVIIFFMDVFYFHKLDYFFKVLWISIFVFLPYYIIYCFHRVSESLIIFLENNLENITTDYVYGVLPPEKDYWHDDYIFEEDEPDEEPPHHMHLTVRKYFEFKYASILFNREVSNYFSLSFTKKYYYDFKKENKIIGRLLNQQETKLLYQPLNNSIKTVTVIYKILIMFEKIQKDNAENKNMKAIFTLITWFYFLSWFYILVVSIRTLSIFEVLMLLEMLTSSLYDYNPFSNP